MSIRRRLLGTLLLAVCCGAAAACTAQPDYVSVDPSGRAVRVELRRTVGFFRQHVEPMLLSECGFYRGAQSAGTSESPFPQEIWRIVATSSDHGVRAIQYGVIPEGFAQATPAAEPPPPLEPGRRYTVECSGDGMGITEFTMPKLVTRPAPPLKKREE